MKKTKYKQADIEQIIKERDDLKEKYLRALADYQNLEKRMVNLRLEESKYASKGLLMKIFPIIDDLERAQKTINNTGLSLTLKNLFDVLKGEMVEKVTVLEKEFDPIEMECIEVVETTKDKDNKVVEELQPAYKINDKIIRVAKVKVGKANKS